MDILVASRVGRASGPGVNLVTLNFINLVVREGVDRRPPSCRSYRGYILRENTTLDMFRIYEHFNLVTY